MSELQRFLKGDGRDGAGRTIDDVLSFDDDQLERRHDFIQWLFPMLEPSRVVPGSPVLRPDDVDALRASATAQANLSRAAERMLRFYARTPQWRRAFDHNHLRITRIIRSLRLLAGGGAADEFRTSVLTLAGEATSVNEASLRFWREA